MVLRPHPLQRLRCARCSVTSRARGGTSTTCLRRWPLACTPANVPPHPSHSSGTWTTTCSGSSTKESVLPGCPFCPPGFLALLPLRLLGLGLSMPSLEGGLLELRLFLASHSSSLLSRCVSEAIISCWDRNCSCWSAICANRRSTSSTTAFGPCSYTAKMVSRGIMVVGASYAVVRHLCNPAAIPSTTWLNSYICYHIEPSRCPVVLSSWPHQYEYGISL